MASRNGGSSSSSSNVSLDPPGALRDHSGRPGLDIPDILPHEKVFPIQIGSEMFRLSGASISSDAPSYFSQFFKCQLKQSEQSKEGGGEATTNIRTLYIDRDPVTFRDISRHLQGYHIRAQDSAHYVKLFADAQFYQLPRLVNQLYEQAIYISIGGREFQVPREIFSNPGDSPNYFTLGFAFLFSSSTEVFPGLNREGLLRPPSILPPEIPNRSADIFTDLIHLLRGYPLHIRNEEHRAELLRDCRYFLFRGLEQKLIPHHIGFNLLRQREEITIRLEDIRQPGLSFAADHAVSDSRPGIHGWVNYARQYVDDRPYELIVEISNEWTRVNAHALRAEFFGDGKKRISRLFEVVANKLNLPTTQPLGLLMATGGAVSQPASPGNTPISEDHVKIDLETAHIILDGRDYQKTPATDALSGADDDAAADEASRSSSVASSTYAGPHSQRKRRRLNPSLYSEAGGDSGSGLWIVRNGQWRLRVQSAVNGKSGIECVLVAVKLDAVTCEIAGNEARSFLGR